MLSAACALTAQAQDAATGAISGVVRTLAGVAMASVPVQLTSLATGAVASSMTDRLGEFVLVQLPPGSYRLRVTAGGFAAVQMQDVVVVLGQTQRLALVLTVATVAQSVQVRAQDAALPMFDSPVNEAVSPAQLQGLPVEGRRLQSLAVLTPLAAADDSPMTDAESGEVEVDSDNARVSVRGGDPMRNSYLVDGANLARAYDGESRGGREVPFTLPLGAVREFRVAAVVTVASPGHDAASSIETVTERGELDSHGSVFFLLRNSAVGAANPFAIATRYNAGAPTATLVKPRDQREQFGGALGGHLRHDVFVFAAVEAQRRSFPAVSSPSDASLYNLTTVQQALLANRGVSVAATAKALTFLDGLGGTVARHADELVWFPRLDWQPGTRTAATVSWSHVRFTSPSGQRSAPVVDLGRASLAHLATHGDQALLHVRTTIAPRWLNEFRAGWSRDAEFAQRPAPLPQEPATGPGGAVPQVSIASVFSFGSPAALGARRLPEELRSEVAETVVYSGRAHTVSLGLNVSGLDERIGAREASSGAYEYTSGITNGRAGGLVDFITDYTYSATSYPNGGCPSIYATVHLFCFRSFAQTFGSVPETRFHTVEWSAFLADAWRVTPRLRVEAGLRYERNRLPPAQHANVALDAVFGDFAATANTPRDTNNLGPHVGVAYAPATHMVLRVGYGFSFGNLPGRMVQAALENTAMPASQTRLLLTPRTVLDPACASAGTNFGYPATYVCAPFGPAAPAGQATLLARGLQMPAVQTAELSITRELGLGVTVSGSYVLALARQLANTTDLNIAASTSRIAFRVVRSDAAGPAGVRNGDVFNVPLYTARRSSAFGPVTAILSNGNATYHALALRVDRRLAQGVAGRVFWTYSKALDNVRVSGSVPDADSQFDPFEPAYDRAPANLDRTHRVVAAAVWSLPWRARGWQVAPVFSATSGRPYSYGILGGTSLPGGRETLNGSGGAAFLPSVGRNTLRLPWTQTVDLRLLRGFALQRGVQLGLSAEAYNLTNHVNPTAVEGRAFLVGTAVGGTTQLVYQDAATLAAEGLTGRAFGVASSSTGSIARERHLQFGLRAQW